MPYHSNIRQWNSLICIVSTSLLGNWKVSAFWHFCQFPLDKRLQNPMMSANKHQLTNFKTITKQRKLLKHLINNLVPKLEMWANGQRDGCPAKYRWRPLFNTAKFGWPPLLECCAVTLPKRESRWNLLGVPQTRQQISATSGPKFTILWGHVGEVLLFNKFFSNCCYMP